MAYNSGENGSPCQNSHICQIFPGPKRIAALEQQGNFKFCVKWPCHVHRIPEQSTQMRVQAVLKQREHRCLQHVQTEDETCLLATGIVLGRKRKCMRGYVKFTVPKKIPLSDRYSDSINTKTDFPTRLAATRFAFCLHKSSLSLMPSSVSLLSTMLSLMPFSSSSWPDSREHMCSDCMRLLAVQALLLGALRNHLLPRSHKLGHPWLIRDPLCHGAPDVSNPACCIHACSMH